MVEQLLESADRTSPAADQLDPDQGHQGKSPSNQQRVPNAEAVHAQGLEELDECSHRLDLRLKQNAEDQQGPCQDSEPDVRADPVFPEKEEHDDARQAIECQDQWRRKGLLSMFPMFGFLSGLWHSGRHGCRSTGLVLAGPVFTDEGLHVLHRKVVPVFQLFEGLVQRSAGRQIQSFDEIRRRHLITLFDICKGHSPSNLCRGTIQWSLVGGIH